MDLIITLAMRNTLRNRRRTLLTALTVFLGAALMTIGTSLVAGVLHTFIVDATRSSGHVRLTTSAYAERSKLNPIYENISDTTPFVEALKTTPGVTGVYPRIQLGVAASDGDEIGDVWGLLVGAPLDYYSDQMDLDDRIASGTFFTGAANEALVGRALAKAIGLEAGQEAIFLGATQDGSPAPIKVTAVGIVDTGNGAFDKQVYVPLAAARWVADIPDGAVELLVFSTDADGAGALVGPILERARSVPGGESLAAEVWFEREELSSLLGILGRVGKMLGVIIAFVTALGVLNTMMMSVLERTGEIGVLRAMGMGTPGVMAMFVVEALTIAVLGGLLGAIVGSIAALALQQVGIDLGSVAEGMPDTLPVHRTLHLRWTPDVAARALALAFVVAGLGSAIPALRAARIQPVEAMRSKK